MNIFYLNNLDKNNSVIINNIIKILIVRENINETNSLLHRSINYKTIQNLKQKL